MKLDHFTGKFVIHCHNIEHGDHDMMGQIVVPVHRERFPQLRYNYKGLV